MATISASARFTLNGLNFSTLSDNEPQLFNNVFERFRGETYEDILTLRDDEDAGANFGGRNFALKNSGAAKTGIVEVIEGVEVGDQPVFAIQGLNLRLTAVDTAIGTTGFRDDLAIWQDQFSGNDTMKLSGANDVMRGFDGNDVMRGFGGADKLSGDAGRDKIFGGNGKDTLEGGASADELVGGRGDDLLRGGGAADRLDGGENSDILVGGKGADVFVFDGVGGSDTIRDFGKGADMLKLKNDIDGVRGLSNAEIVDQFAHRADGNIIFEFDSGDTLVLEGYTRLGTLDDFIV